MKALPSLMAAAILLLGTAAGAATDLRQVRRAYVQGLLRGANHAVPSSVMQSQSFALAAMSRPDGDDRDRAADIPPGLAFLMSAALPGTGQLAEGRNRAFAYLGLEAISWVAHFSWKDAGNNKEKEYQAYARQHWTLDTYAVNADSCATALPPGLNYADSRQTLEQFIQQKNWQHYYEDIGKLEAYRAGWDDFDCATSNQMSPNRVEYRSMRAKSNDYLNNARLALTVAFLNRFVSAVDAWRTARGARLRVAGADVKLSVGGSIARPKATVRLTRNF